MVDLAFPARLTQGPDGRFTVTFRDLPEVLTDGATREEALAEGADALRCELDARRRGNLAMRTPSVLEDGEVMIAAGYL